MFKRTSKSLPTSPVVYPSGTFIHTEKGYFYIVAEGRRFRLVSQRVVDSWSPHRIVETSEAAVQKYRIAAKMKFRNGSLINSISDGKIYLIEEGKRRHIIEPDVFTRLGMSMDDSVTVSLDEINLHEEGEQLR